MFSFSNKRQGELNPAALVNGASDNYSQGTVKGEEGSMLSQEEFVNRKIAELEAQHKAFLEKKPDFDMRAELDNQVFSDYIWKNGLTVEDAYILAHKEEIIEDAVKDALTRISQRRNRISENGASKNSPVSVKKNPKEMSDKEIDSIIERVRNGEKISF